MDELVALQGPVEVLDGQLVLRIPLGAGGDTLAAVAKGISRVEAEDLIVMLPAWLALKLGIVEGSLVAVDNQNGKFNITPVGTTEPTA